MVSPFKLTDVLAYLYKHIGKLVAAVVIAVLLVFGNIKFESYRANKAAKSYAVAIASLSAELTEKTTRLHTLDVQYSAAKERIKHLEQSRKHAPLPEPLPDTPTVSTETANQRELQYLDVIGILDALAAEQRVALSMSEQQYALSQEITRKTLETQRQSAQRIEGLEKSVVDREKSLSKWRTATLTTSAVILALLCL